MPWGRRLPFCSLVAILGPGLDGIVTALECRTEKLFLLTTTTCVQY